MEWYSTAQGGYNNTQYQYAPPPSAHTAHTYASFDDEPPLLEGKANVGGSSKHQQLVSSVMGCQDGASRGTEGCSTVPHAAAVYHVGSIES